MDPDAEKRLVLVIDSDPAHSSRLTAVLRAAGYGVESTPHDMALEHLPEGNPFDGVILCAAPEPSTLSPQDRLGEFVLRYMTYVVPALLPRTIVLTTLVPDAGAFAGTHAVLAEPLDDDELLRILAVCVRL